MCYRVGDVVIPLNGVLRASVCISSMKLGFPEFRLAAAWSAAVPPSWSVACSPLCWPSCEDADDDVVSFAPWQPKQSISIVQIVSVISELYFIMNSVEGKLR